MPPQIQPRSQRLAKLGYSSYKNYIASPYWQERRAAYYARHPRECYVCTSQKSVVLHHRRYTTLGREQDWDLIPLCSRCHDLLHSQNQGLTKIVERMRQRYIECGEQGLKPSLLRDSRVRVVNASRLSDEEKAQYALDKPESPQSQSVAAWSQPRCWAADPKRMYWGRR